MQINYSLFNVLFSLYNLNADLSPLFSHYLVKSLASWVTYPEPALAQQSRLRGTGLILAPARWYGQSLYCLRWGDAHFREHGVQSTRQQTTVWFHRAVSIRKSHQGGPTWRCRKRRQSRATGDPEGVVGHTWQSRQALSIRKVSLHTVEECYI